MGDVNNSRKYQRELIQNQIVSVFLETIDIVLKYNTRVKIWWTMTNVKFFMVEVVSISVLRSHDSAVTKLMSL